MRIAIFMGLLVVAESNGWKAVNQEVETIVAIVAIALMIMDAGDWIKNILK